MHTSAYLAFESIQLEIVLSRENVTLSIGACNYGGTISVTLSRTQTEALSIGLQEALHALAPAQSYPDVTLKKIWAPAETKTPQETFAANTPSENDNPSLPQAA